MSRGTGLVGQGVPSICAVDFNDLVARETFPRDLAFGGEEKLIPQWTQWTQWARDAFFFQIVVVSYC